MITVETSRDFASGDIIGRFVVPAKDMREINLDRIDRMVIESPENSAADIFQSLEILARRQSEQTKEIV